jgi:hypothetical protein
MALFTVFIDYDGGTYISNIRGRDVVQAFRRWMKAYPSETIPRIKGVSRAKLAAEFHDKASEPLLVHNQGRVWCHGGLLNDKLALLYLIQTVEGQSNIGR